MQLYISARYRKPTSIFRHRADIGPIWECLLGSSSNSLLLQMHGKAKMVLSIYILQDKSLQNILSYYTYRDSITILDIT